MYIKTTKAALLEAIQCVISPIPTRGTLPVLSNILIACDGESATLTATDLEIQLSARAMVESDGGEITIPARKLHDVTKALPDGASIKIVCADGKATMTSGRSRYTLATLPASEFPDNKTEAFRHKATIDAAALLSLIELTSHAQAANDVRFYLNGTLFEIRSDGLRLVATDGHRMAVAGAGGDLLASVIVPVKAVGEIKRMLKGGDCTLEVNENSARITASGITMTSKLIGGKFPAYESVIPDTPVTASCDRPTLIGAISRAKIMSHDKYRGIRLEAADGAIRITASNTEHDSGDEEVPAEVITPVACGYNAEYLLDALGSLSVDTVELALLSEGAAVMRDSATTQVVMALRL